jgi:Lon protease-like protein
MLEDPVKSPRLAAVPLFPLPNVVLFPRAVLPLHVFEERYKTMTADALGGDRQIAMALLRPGWERDYYHKPPIEPVVCVGSILSHERLGDGKYNLLLQGHTRARIVREHLELPLTYRVAQLAPIDQTPVMEIDLTNSRRRLVEIFASGALAQTGIGRQFRQILGGPISTADVADLIAFNFLEDIPLKQSLLADPDVQRRVARTVDALDQMRPILESSAQRRVADPGVN